MVGHGEEVFGEAGDFGVGVEFGGGGGLAGWDGGFEHFLRISKEFIGNELFSTVRWLLLVMVDFYCFVVSLDVIGAILVDLVYAG